MSEVGQALQILSDAVSEPPLSNIIILLMLAFLGGFVLIGAQEALVWWRWRALHRLELRNRDRGFF